MIKKLISLSMAILMVLSISACSNSDDNKVIIYSSSEDFRNEHILKRLEEQFPSYDISLQYLSTGNNAAKLKAEGTKTECDIILGLDSAYLKSIESMLADLSSYDTSMYLDELVDPDKKYLSWERFSGCIAVNTKLLNEKKLPMPVSYDDLLNPIYKDLISMPNPKASGTGYMFLLNRINTIGEDKAFEYFDKLSSNVLQFTSSGSGPVNALVQGEVIIALGMTFQSVSQINSQSPIEILYFAEGAPFSTGGMAIVDRKQDKKAVKEVFDYIYSTLIYEDKELFVPEKIFKEQEIKIANYPKDIIYGDMSGALDIVEKERILNKWKY